MAIAFGIVVSTTVGKSCIHVLRETCNSCHSMCVRIRTDKIEVREEFEVGTKVKIDVATSTLFLGTFLVLGVPIISAIGTLFITKNFLATTVGLILGAMLGVVIYRMKNPEMLSNFTVEAIS